MDRNRGTWKKGIAGLALAAAAAAGLVGAYGPAARAEEKPAEAAPATQRLVFAHYYYYYQGDTRKAVPFRRIRDKQGLTQLTNHPWESCGPWMSFDRAMWHKNHFQMMAAGGIDVALAVYRGDRDNRRAYAIKGLDVMTQALKELRSEGLAPFTRPREYPQIGMALDLGGLADQYGGPVDLKSQDAQRSLYGMIRDFYLHVPEEFRATVQLPAPRVSPGDTIGTASTPQGTAYVVRLLNDAAVKDADGAFIGYANKRFAQEFGARLVWVGTPALKRKVPALDATAPFPSATQDASVSKDGWLRIGSVGPGYDAEGRNGDTRIRPRENGQQTILDYRAVVNAGPEWVFIDSWNGYDRGSDIAPTLEHGLLYRDLTRAAVLQFKQGDEYSANILKTTTPRVVRPGVIYQVDVAVQNTGTTDWDAFNLASLSYRWLKNGEPVGDPGANATSNGQVRGDAKSYIIGVAAPMSTGKALPGGQYEIEFNMTHRVGDENVWFDQATSAPYRIPVTVGDIPAGRPYWINSTMPAMVRRGAAYPAQLRIRNDGSDAWKKGSVSVGYRWRKVSTYLKGASEDADTVVAEGKRVPIEADVQPGRLITVEAPVSTTDASGAPLATWSTQDDWVYVLEWDLFEGDKPLSAGGGATYREPVEVLDRDPAPSFIGCSLPSELVAGRNQAITVGLVNDGPENWVKGRDKVVVHWYYMDGTEASWNDDALPLPDDVPAFSRVQIQVPLNTGPKLPGEAEEAEKKKDKKAPKFRTETIQRPIIMRDVPVRVPYYFGPMYCVFDFQHDGMNSSTSSASKGNDVLVIPVNVYSPTFSPVPMMAYYNVDGMSQDVDRGDGDIDGRGNSLPAEFLPPYVNRPAVGVGPAPSPLYPSGLWVSPLNDLEASRVCFMYPSKNNNTPNMMRCAGQEIQFPGLQRGAVHLLAICTEEDVTAEFVLTYGDGTTEKKKLTFTHWTDAPKHGERVAFTTPHRHTPSADDPGTRCYLNQYSLPTDRSKPLIGIQFPKQPAIKVMAVTLESASARLQ